MSNGLELTLIESDGSIRWTVKTLFRIHSINYQNGILAKACCARILRYINNRWQHVT